MAQVNFRTPRELLQVRFARLVPQVSFLNQLVPALAVDVPRVNLLQQLKAGNHLVNSVQ